MSEGPIKREREAWKPKQVSTTAKDRVCGPGTGLNETLGRSYCGRSSAKRTASWDDVTCADCQAARRADEAVAS